MSDDIDIDDLHIPDAPQTSLAFRTWRLSDSGKLLSINAPSITGKAGGNPNQPVRKISWIHRQLADDEGQDGWPAGKPLVAHCGRGMDIMTGVPGIPGGVAVPSKNSGHGPIPDKHCSCGIYATTSIEVINQYLGNEVIMGTIAIRGSVLGVVELGGRVIPATQGFRAAYARVAAILLIDQAFTLSHPQLQSIAEDYRVPALIPHSLNPEDYRDQLKPQTQIADEAEKWLRELQDEGGEE